MPRFCEHLLVRRTLEATIVLKFQAEPDVVDESPIAINNRTKIDQTRWCQFDSCEIMSLDLCLPLSRHDGEETQCATVMYQGL